MNLGGLRLNLGQDDFLIKLTIVQTHLNTF